MNWIEKVRGLLEGLKQDCEECGAPDDIEITGGYGLDIEGVWELCLEALAAIPDEDPMMKLLEWLDETLKECESRRNHISAGTYQGVMRYIEREFDCKLPEEGDIGQEDDSPPQA